MRLFSGIALVERGLADARAELGLLALECLDLSRGIRQFLRLPERKLLVPRLRCTLDGGTQLGRHALRAPCRFGESQALRVANPIRVSADVLLHPSSSLEDERR